MLQQRIQRAITAAPFVSSLEDANRLFYGRRVEPSVIRVATSRELGHLLLESHEVMDWNVDVKQIEGIVHHEEEHAEAGRLLGAEAVDFALGFVWTPAEDPTATGRLNLYPSTATKFVGTLSSIRSAALAAYPSILNEGDMFNIRSHGFADVDDLTRTIQLVNADTHHPIPLPKSRTPH